MNVARLFVAITGILLPYLVRIPGGSTWLEQYTNVGFDGFLFLSGFNAIAWGSIVVLSFLYRRPESLLFPCLCGFGYLGWAHYTLDLASDAQAAIALIYIPLYALTPILVGVIVGLFFDLGMRKPNVPGSPSS